MKFSVFKLTNYKTKHYHKNKILNQSSKDQKHEIALQISNVGLWDWDIITNKVFYSEESEQMIGYSKNALKNTSKVWDDKVHPEDREVYFKNEKEI